MLRRHFVGFSENKSHSESALARGLMAKYEEPEDALISREYHLKRYLDFTLALCGLIISLPLWLAICLAILLEDGMPIFYGSWRVGRGGQRFKAYKFRTMTKDSDTRFGPLQAVEHDPRVTRVGRVLRSMALDELPQLFSILLGDMSFVGPRALLPSEIEKRDGRGESVPIETIPGYRKRHSVRPGLTGIAQVFAPRDILRRHKFRYDLLYLKRMSLWLDLRLIFLSFWISIRGKWESRSKKY